MKCGLLGKKLGHSYSPQIHSLLADYSYELFEKQPEELEHFLQYGDFTGLNVTMPYKKDVIPYLDELTPRARMLGAVNTIVRTSEGKLIGHNTDYFGFSSMVQRTGLKLAGKKVLVLGSGGASSTVCAVLRELNACITLVSRNGENNYSNLHLHKDASVIINTTPLWMYPNVGNSPVDLDAFPRLEGVLDVVYNPARTKILMDAEKHGLIAENGLWMLIAQAKESAEWFSGKKIDDSEIEKIYHKLRFQMLNLILIGMPGCGKSTIGKLLAEKTGKRFIDADEEVVKLAGKAIPDIFSQSGELGFRELETKILHTFGMKSGLVISTGGGCVTKKENYESLHQNGTIIWLQRDISSLPTDGRPLSITGDLEKMYLVREPMYEKFADFGVDNNGPVEQTLQNILMAGGLM